MKKILLIGLLLSACTPKESLKMSSENLSIPVESTSISSYSFGDEILQGSTVADKIFTFTKNASATEGADTTVSLDNSVDFSVVTATGCNKTLTKASEKCQVKVRFMKSKVAGAYEGALNVGGNEVELSATVLSPTPTGPTISVKEGTTEVTTLAFGAVNKNTASSKLLTIANTGSATTNLAVSLMGDSVFSISSNNCGTSLAKGKSCSMRVLFSSGAGSVADEEKSSSLTLASGIILPVSGIVRGTPVIVGNPLIKFYEGSVAITTLSFGTISSGSLSKVLIVKNEGTAPNSTAISYAGDFSLMSNSCGASLAVGATCQMRLALSFDQDHLGSKSGSVTSGSASLAISGVTSLTLPPCDEGTHREGMTCVSNSRLCSAGELSAIDQALAGQASWLDASSSWQCTPTSCNVGYSPVGQVCKSKYEVVYDIPAGSGQILSYVQGMTAFAEVEPGLLAIGSTSAGDRYGGGYY